MAKWLEQSTSAGKEPGSNPGHACLCDMVQTPDDGDLLEPKHVSCHVQNQFVGKGKLFQIN